MPTHTRPTTRPAEFAGCMFSGDTVGGVSVGSWFGRPLRLPLDDSRDCEYGPRVRKPASCTSGLGSGRWPVC